MTGKRKRAKRLATSGKSEDKTPGEENCDWIVEHCRIPEGMNVGKEVELRVWQRRDILRIYDNPAGTRRAILSFGRKNAKTTLAAFLLLLHLCGPPSRPNSQLNSTALSRDQAAILFKLAAKIVRLSPTLHDAVVVRDSVKELYYPARGTIYKALSADAATAYGLSPVFIVHDELGQVKGPRSELYEALETAVGAHKNPLSIIISTQAPTDADLLSVLIDDAKAEHDPRVVLSLYTAALDITDPFSEEAIRQANPAFGDFLNATEVLAMAEDARRMPSRQAEYENLVLNRRVEINNPFISRIEWMACVGVVEDDWSGLPVYGGLDLSSTSDLTSLTLIAPVDGKWHVKPTFWLPGEGLREKAQKDRFPYDQWAREGFLLTTPGNSIEYEYVAEYLRGVFDKLDVRCIGFDDWAWNFLRPWLVKADFSEEELGRFFAFRQGTKSMTPALRDLESTIRQRKLVHDDNPVLSMCAANAVVEGVDDARKLSKAKSRGRIDGMITLAMAKSVAGTIEEVVSLDINAMIA